MLDVTIAGHDGRQLIAAHVIRSSPRKRGPSCRLIPHARDDAERQAALVDWSTDVHDHRVTSIAQLEALYGQPAGAAVFKEIDHISAEYRAFIEASPFFVLATNGPEGVDCSPRGDDPGFVRVADEKTLMIPDRRGNNRIDSLRNIVRDPRVSLLFLVPGVGETIRVIGRAAHLDRSGAAARASCSPARRRAA